jgi:galactose mutarotase-like enzyme
MLTTLKNSCLTVTASTLGAELQSIESAEGTSYLWDGQPAYWSGRAPNLFPCVGALRDNCAESAAGKITLQRHGFARKSEWLVETAGDTSVTYLLTSNDVTRESYPYDFEARVRYDLNGTAVSTTYTIRNTGKSVMPYCVGGHTGFHVPLTEGENFEDYIVEFEQPETVDCPQVDISKGLIINKVRNRFMTDTTSFSLNHVLFRGDALVFDRLKSRSVRLYSKKSGRGVKMDFEGMDYFAVWSPFADCPFVCLEPWTGTATQVTEDDIFEHKQGVTLLEPGCEKENAFTISVF